MNEQLHLHSDDPRILFWVERLKAHHHGSIPAIEAQLRHIGQEYGEALSEWGSYMGDNPRKPADVTARSKFLHECSDIVITTLILMAIADEQWMHHFNQKLSATVQRMKEFDRQREDSE